MNIHKFSLGVRFDMIASPITMELESRIWEEIFSVLTVFDVSGLNLYGGILQPSCDIYMCVFTGGSLTQMRRIFDKLDNDAGVSMYLTSARPFIQKNELASMPDLPYLGKVQHNGKLTGGQGLPVLVPKKHGKKRPVGRGIKIMLVPDGISAELPSLLAIKRLTAAARKHFPGVKIVPVPIAHGGNGTVDAAVLACDGAYRYADIRNEDGTKCRIKYGVLYGRTGIIEAVPGETSVGTGELIRRVLDEGIKDIVIGIGKLDMPDCGLGCLRALGVKFFDENDNELTGEPHDIGRIKKVDTEFIHPRVADAQFTVMLDEYDGMNVSSRKESGTGFAEASGCESNARDNLASVLNVKFKPSTEALFEAVDFAALLKGVALVVTGEGRLTGKNSDVIKTVVKNLSGRKVPVAAITDSKNENGGPYLSNIGVMITVDSPMDRKEAAERSLELFDDAADRMFRFIRIGRDVEKIGAPKSKKRFFLF
jgi:glycerate kinase